MERKSIILLLLVLMSFVGIAQTGAYRANKLQLSGTSTYNQIAYGDTYNTLKFIPNGVGYLHNNNGVFSYSDPSGTGSYVTGLSFSGTTTKSLTLTQLAGETLTASFTDNDSWPGFGTSHTTAAYGDHNHSGVYQPAGSYDNYVHWLLSANFGSSYNISSNTLVDFYNGSGVTMGLSAIIGGFRITPNLDIYGLTTIANPQLAGFLPYTTTGTNTKITLSTLQTTIGSTAGTAGLNVIRDGSGDAYAHNFILSSDKRLKQNIKPLKKLDWVDSIKFVQFESKDDKTHRERFGVIAQEVEKINPDLIYTDENGMKAVGYTDLIIAKLAAMEQKINDLTQKVEDLEFINQGQKELLKMKKFKRHAK